MKEDRFESLVKRPRRLRQHANLRDLVREHRLGLHDLIYPLFVYHGKNLRREIASMPGQYQLSLDRLAERLGEVAELKIPAILLFGIPAHKDARGSSASDDAGIVQEAIRVAKRETPELFVITDVCFCEYTDHGHCGPLTESGGRVDVDNDATLPLLAEQALSHARAGADMVAPSGMMDGMVGAIRAGLDLAGFTRIPILSYAAKFASAYYGPFRDAAESAPAFGDRRSYQMDPANGDEALREVELDLAEGADIVMVKPALAYLDIVRRVKDGFGVPVAAYNVSGEYAMIKAAAARGWIDERRVVLETLTGFKRAGADMILTYHALDAARWLREGE
jgi:porphobilinogen synthase